MLPCHGLCNGFTPWALSLLNRDSRNSRKKQERGADVVAFELPKTACIGIQVVEMLQDLSFDYKTYILHSAHSSRTWRQMCHCKVLNNQSLVLIRVTFQHHCQP